MFFHSKTLISVCIPLYGTEALLLRCLESVAAQKFEHLDQIEVIVVDDGSPAAENSPDSKIKKSGKEIVKAFKKTVDFPVIFIQHNENKGLVEARRSAVYRAKGEFILILDSDDELTENALKTLYETAQKSGADIVQAKAQAVYSETELKALDSVQSEKYKNFVLSKINKVHIGQLSDKEILSGYFENKNHNGILWNKLIKRKVYLKALYEIPPVFCTMAEDVLQYFWIALYAKKYTGIEAVVYKYSINTGISSRTKIESLERWEKICSTASVFTAIYTRLQELEQELKHPLLTPSQSSYLNFLCRFYLENNLIQLKAAVVPQIKEKAYKMLCDYWGENFVKKIQAKMAEENSAPEEL